MSDKDKNNKIKQSRELTEAFLMLNTEERISEQALALYAIYQDPEAKMGDKINAIKLIWDYAMAKPKQAIGLEMDKDIIININEGVDKDDRPQPGV